MANNNLVLIVVLVAAALLLFNGGLNFGGLSGQAVVSRSCTGTGPIGCIYGNPYDCFNSRAVQSDECTPLEQCNFLQRGQQVVAAFCSTEQSGSTMVRSTA